MLNEIKINRESVGGKALEQTLEKINTGSMATFLLLFGLAALLPFFIHIQWLTGPIMNAIFIIVLFLSGLRSAIIVAFVPSLMALSGGLLPLPLAPAVPFIMFSNLIFIFIIQEIYHARGKFSGYWTAIVSASFCKSLFLFLIAFLVVKIINKPELGKVVFTLMGPAQFISAILGGMIAYIILKWLKRF